MLSVKKIVKDELVKFISALTIYIGYCKDEKLSQDKLLEAEMCLKKKLKPILNP